jgi:hypothetical protein
MITVANYAPNVHARHGQLALIPEGANAVQLELSFGLTRELTQVRINSSFIFGLLEDQMTWSLFRLNHVLALRFQIQNPEASPAVTWTRKTAGELLASLDLPAPATLWLQKEPCQKIGLVVLGTTRGLVATNSQLMPFVPLQAISYLEISPH